MLLVKMAQLPSVSKLPKIIAMDTETHPDMTIEGLSFAYMDGRKMRSFYIPISHSDIPEPFDNFDKLEIGKYIKRLVKGRSVIFHHAQFDLTVLKTNFDIEIPDAKVEDTMLLHYTLDTERKHGLKTIMQVEYGKDVMKYDEAVSKGFGVFAKYADYDARFTLFLWMDLMRKAKKLPKSLELYRKYEIPFIRVLQDMNRFKNFIRIDEPLLYRYNELITEELFLIKDMIMQKLEIENPSSPKQLGMALEAKGYDVPRTDKGNFSTGEKIITNMYKRQKGLILSAIVYYRGISKQENTYFRPMYERLEKIRRDVYVITGYDFSHIGTRHGRMSAHNPNLQNQTRDPVFMKMLLTKELKRMGFVKSAYITDTQFKKIMNKIKNNDTKDSELDSALYKRLFADYTVDIRKVFIPLPGRIFIGADFSQIELRMAAHLSKDKNMVKEFLKDKADIHVATMEAVNAILKGKFEIDRQGAKEYNFGLIYGLYWTTIADKLGITQKAAKAFYEGYFQHYSEIAAFKLRIQQSARKSHYVQTILGRRRNMNTVGINSHGRNKEEFKKRKWAENATISTIVSGSSSDLIKIAMINLFQKYRGELDQKIQVHDELILETDIKGHEKFIEIVREKMEGAMKLDVPVVVDILTGYSWREVH